MPVASLRFYLPDEEHEFRAAIDGHKWCAVVSGIAEKLRSRSKYENVSDERAGELALVRQWLTEALAEEGLALP